MECPVVEEPPSDNTLVVYEQTPESPEDWPDPPPFVQEPDVEPEMRLMAYQQPFMDPSMMMVMPFSPLGNLQALSYMWPNMMMPQNQLVPYVPPPFDPAPVDEKEESEARRMGVVVFIGLTALLAMVVSLMLFQHSHGFHPSDAPTLLTLKVPSSDTTKSLLGLTFIPPFQAYTIILGFVLLFLGALGLCLLLFETFDVKIVMTYVGLIVGLMFVLTRVSAPGVKISLREEPQTRLMCEPWTYSCLYYELVGTFEGLPSSLGKEYECRNGTFGRYEDLLNLVTDFIRSHLNERLEMCCKTWLDHSFMAAYKFMNETCSPRSEL